jgi:uncharacterized protein YceH (UPF0502 family)
MSAEGSQTRGPLSPRERRVVGVLIEKQKTTPDNYPMTVAALVAGCNQRSNRDPVTNYDADDVEDTLQDLRRKGVVVRYEGTGRVERWKHLMYDWLGLRDQPVEMAVLAELLLRGPQTEGELRARASRMAPLPDLAALQDVLESLKVKGLVVPLTPPGRRRGVVVTHGLYPPDELERVRQSFVSAGDEDDDEPEGAPRPARAARDEELERLREELAALRATVEGLAADVAALKAELGA